MDACTVTLIGDDSRTLSGVGVARGRHGPSLDARLVVDADLAAAVAALVPEGMAARRLDDGRLVLRAAVRDAGSLFDWLIPFGGAIEIASPDDLRAQMAVRLETTASAWARG